MFTMPCALQLDEKLLVGTVQALHAMATADGASTESVREVRRTCRGAVQRWCHAVLTRTRLPVCVGGWVWMLSQGATALTRAKRFRMLTKFLSTAQKAHVLQLLELVAPSDDELHAAYGVVKA